MKKITEIDIVGAGTAGCLAVLYLSSKFPEIAFNWYFPEKNQPIGVGEGSSDELILLLNKVDIHFQQLVTECDATIKLGIQFEGWRHADHKYFHPFSSERGNFHEMNNMCTMKLKNKIPHDVFDNYRYGIHFDSYKMQEFLIGICKKRKNVTINHIDIDNIDQLKGNLVIDSTGFKRHITGKIDSDNFVDYREKNCNNAARAIKLKYTDKNNQSLPYTIAKASEENGWFWYIPLKDEIGFGHVYNKNIKHTDKEFIKFIESKIGHDHDYDLTNYKNLEFINGRARENLIDYNGKYFYNIGLSSGFIEPLEAKGLHISIQSIYFLEDFLLGNLSKHQVNKLFTEEFDSCINFIHMHYFYTDRENNYWNFFKNSKPDFQVTNEYEWVESCMTSGVGYDHDLMRKCLVTFHDQTTVTTLDATKQLVKAIPYNKWRETYEKYA